MFSRGKPNIYDWFLSPVSNAWKKAANYNAKTNEIVFILLPFNSVEFDIEPGEPNDVEIY